MLLKKRWINKKQYEQASKIKEATGKHYGAILVNSGIIKAAELKPAVELQATRIIESVFALRHAEFEFTEEPLPSADIVSLRLSAANLIYRDVKGAADVQLLKDHFLESIVDFSNTPLNLFQHITLTGADKAILSFIDGKTSIRDIAKLSPYRRIDPFKIIYALLETRICEIKRENMSPSGISHQEILDKTQESSEEIIRKIEHMHINYQSLGITASSV